MKRFTFLATLVAVVGAASVTYAFSQKNQKDLSDLQLTAIEVLSDEEGEEKGVLSCYNTITSSDTHTVRYCPTCESIEGDDVWYSPKSTCVKN
ncbi:MAG: hypothetical protein K2L01_01060 [Rikenellaceae bacterium]|nr:hypothetical protein [Rikenellaceae bacterium]